ncbi:Integrase core domain containing protein [Dirofilaria immitis]|nr:Integrase core domain containing protein [Dirofilaria immitis]
MEDQTIQVTIYAKLPRIKRSRTFARIGLDYLGPITVKERRNKKRWISLFTCFTTRAVHLKLADDSSAENFLTYKEKESQLANFLTNGGMIWSNITTKALRSGRIYERIRMRTNGTQTPRSVEIRIPSEGEVAFINELRTTHGIGN